MSTAISEPTLPLFNPMQDIIACRRSEAESRSPRNNHEVILKSFTTLCVARIAACSSRRVGVSASLALLFVVGSLLLPAKICIAQATNGRISGTVKDPTGAVVPQAEIVVTRVETGISVSRKTDGVGNYVFPNLLVGVYNVSVIKDGFESEMQTGLGLVSDGKLTVDFHLAVGSVEQKIVVDAAGESVNRTSGEDAYTINGNQVRDTALNMRNYLSLTALDPGTALTQLDPIQQTINNATDTQSVNGNRARSTSLSVDGANNLDPSNNAGQHHNVSVEFIQQVKIQSSSFSSEYGNYSGAAINVITRGGTNQFHGTLLEFFRNDAIDTRNYFSPVGQKQELRFNDFGVSVGGPVLRHRLFFFGGTEVKRINRSQTPVRTTLPSSAEENGDFSDTITYRSNLHLCQPGTYFTTCAKGANSAAWIPNNDISALMTVNGRAIARIYQYLQTQTVGTFTDRPLSNNATYQLLQIFNTHNDVLRVDYQLRPNQLVYVRFLHDATQAIDPAGTNSGAAVPAVSTHRNSPNYSVMAAHEWTLSSSTYNEFRASYSSFGLVTPPIGNSWMRSTYGFTFPQTFGLGTYSAGIPNVTTNVPASFSGPYFSSTSKSAQISFTDTITKSVRGHVMKLGAAYGLHQARQNGRPNSYTGAVAFSPSTTVAATSPNTTGYATADAFLGNFTSYTESSGDPQGLWRTLSDSIFVDDTWKATRRLSLEFGVRYEFVQPTHSLTNALTNFDPTRYVPADAPVLDPKTGYLLPGTGNRYNGLIRAGQGVPSQYSAIVPNAYTSDSLSVPSGISKGIYHVQNIVTPRFSFALDPYGDGKTSLRGGIGIFFDTPVQQVIYNLLNNPPYLQSVLYQNGNLDNPSGSGGTTILAPFNTIQAIDPHLQRSYTYQTTLNLQQELPLRMRLQVAYVGTFAHHLLRLPNINNASLDAQYQNSLLPSSQQAVPSFLVPYKGYSTINQYRSDASSNYHSLQVHMMKTAGKVRFTGAYTFSKALGVASSDTNANTENPFNRAFNYGPLTFDHTHIIVGTVSYSLPGLAKHSQFLSQPFGGWEISAVSRFQTGDALTVTALNSVNANVRAAYSGASVIGKHTTAAWYNLAAFSAPVPGALGNASVGQIRGPRYISSDISIRKTFPIEKANKFQFQGDLFNLFNHTNFTDPQVFISSSNANTITSANPSRSVQFALKYLF